MRKCNWLNDEEQRAHRSKLSAQSLQKSTPCQKRKRRRKGRNLPWMNCTEFVTLIKLFQFFYCHISGCLPSLPVLIISSSKADLGVTPWNTVKYARNVRRKASMFDFLRCIGMSSGLWTLSVPILDTSASINYVYYDDSAYCELLCWSFMIVQSKLEDVSACTKQKSTLE